MFMRTFTLVSGLVFSISLNAATEFENGMVPIELVRDANSGGGRFYKTLPDNFPLVTLPTGIGLSVIGSVDRGTSQFVLLRNSRTGAEASAALLAAYTAQGWINLAGAPRVTLCHDQHGIMEINNSDTVPGEHRVYIYRSFYPLSGMGVSMNCAEQLAYTQSGGPNAALDFIRSLLPTFELEDGDLPDVFPALRISGSFFTNFSASMNFMVDLPDTTISALSASFVQQLETQGWHVDSSDAGEFSATAVAFKTVQAPATASTAAAEVDLTGYLTILNSEDDKHRVQFSLQAGNGGSFGFIERGPINSPSIGIRGVSPINIPTLGIRGIPANTTSTGQ